MIKTSQICPSILINILRYIFDDSDAERFWKAFAYGANKCSSILYRELVKIDEQEERYIYDPFVSAAIEFPPEDYIQKFDARVWSKFEDRPLNEVNYYACIILQKVKSNLEGIDLHCPQNISSPIEASYHREVMKKLMCAFSYLEEITQPDNFDALNICNDRKG